MKIRKINFDVPFPSITWNDTSMVPLNTVSKHYIIEYKEKLENELEKNVKILMNYEIEEIKNQLIKINKYLGVKNEINRK
jgi:hypothetical protein